MTLLHEEIRILYKINQTLVKRQRTKKIHIQAKDILTIEDVHSLIEQKEIVR